MKNYAIKTEHENQDSVYFNIEAEEVMTIGKKMESINEEAYMNGYNWEAFLNSYLQTNNPELLDGLDTDSEAGTYVGLYEKSETEKADKLIKVINDLVNNPDKIYVFLNENGQNIEWD